MTSQERQEFVDAVVAALDGRATVDGREVDFIIRRTTHVRDARESS